MGAYKVKLGANNFRVRARGRCILDPDNTAGTWTQTQHVDNDYIRHKWSLEITLLVVGMLGVSIASSDEVICLAMGSGGGRELTAWARLSLHSFRMERALSVALQRGEGGGGERLLHQ